MKRYWIIAAILLLIGGVFLVIAIMQARGEPLPHETDPDSSRKYVDFVTETDGDGTGEQTTSADSEPPETETENTETDVTEEPTDTQQTETEHRMPDLPSHSKKAIMDFTRLWEINKDICAWIEIDGSSVSYPILQNAYNDKTYLKTAYDGSYYVGGSLFTEHAYNNKDFNDPVTIVYGHYMRSGKLFGALQKLYSDNKSFEEHRDITLYVPGEVRYYKVFAALPFDTYHILATYDFSNRYWYRKFFEMISEKRELGAILYTDVQPEPGDHILMLSTCLNGDSSRRYLVIAILEDDIPVTKGN